MKKRHYIPIICSLMVFLTILSFHSYQNIMATITPPSEKWGRETYIDKTPYKKPASIDMDKDNIWILAAKEDRFTKTILERDKGSIKEIQEIIIPGAALNKLVKYKIMEPYIFWTENYELYMSTKSEDHGYSSKALILEDVKDFNVLSYEGETIVAVAFDKGLRHYKIDGENIVKWGEDYALEKPSHIASSIDDSGTYHTIAIRARSPMEKEIIYLLFSDGKWSLEGKKVEDNHRTNERIGNLEIGLDKELTYIFYGNNAGNSSGESARIFYTTISRDRLDKPEMNFKALVSEVAESSENSYISEISCPDYQEEILRAVVVQNYYDDIKEGFNVLGVSFKEGSISNVVAATNTFQWVKGIDAVYYEKDEALVFLQAAGEFKNDIWFTQTGEQYRNIMKKPTKHDYILALGNGITPYISGLIIAMIRAFIFLPAIFWLIFVEFFEIKKFILNPKLNYSIAIGVYMILKIVSVNFYYTGLSYYMMPDFMKPMIVKYLIMISIGAIAYLVAKEYKKSMPDMHIIPEFLLFMLHDLLATVFLYGPYIT